MFMIRIDHLHIEDLEGMAKELPKVAGLLLPPNPSRTTPTSNAFLNFGRTERGMCVDTALVATTNTKLIPDSVLAGKTVIVSCGLRNFEAR